MRDYHWAAWVALLWFAALHTMLAGSQIVDFAQRNLSTPERLLVHNAHAASRFVFFLLVPMHDCRSPPGLESLPKLGALSSSL